MIEVFYRLDNIRFGELMCVYEEGNRENADIRYANMDRNAALLQVEQDFFAYLNEVFFVQKNAKYYILIENNKYVCAARMEPYADGYLLTGLETRPEYRRRGYAKKLLREIVGFVEQTIYSHVMKDNLASLKTHYSCGFEIVSEHAEFIDGTTSHSCYTLARK